MNEERTVALVGRPNVGKSRLFNRLSRSRIAIVHDQAGVTRDVNSTIVDKDYMLLDTGGIGLVVDMDHEKLIEAAEEQVWFAVNAASLICFVVDAREGLTPLDEAIAQRLRQSSKQVILVINKVDSPEGDAALNEFSALGFETAVTVSAEHGYNEQGLREAIASVLGPKPESADAESGADEDRVRLAFVGRPNVGKSSICNRLINSDRLVVSEVPGTTRDSVAVDLDFKAPDGTTLPFALVDTAGLRRRGRVSHSVEYFSSVRSRKAIEDAHVVFLVIDAVTGVTRQDKALAGEIVEAGKCVALIVNKWDLALEMFQKEGLRGYDSVKDFQKAFLDAAMREIFFLPSSPALFVSAKTGFSVQSVLFTARDLWQRSGQKLPTPQINQLVERLFKRREPRHIKGKRLKVYYTVQTGNRPFRFRLFCNRASKLEDPYRRFLGNGFVEEFKLDGCPVEFELKGKEKRYANK